MHTSLSVFGCVCVYRLSNITTMEPKQYSIAIRFSSKTFFRRLKLKSIQSSPCARSRLLRLSTFDLTISVAFLCFSHNFGKISILHTKNRKCALILRNVRHEFYVQFCCSQHQMQSDSIRFDSMRTQLPNG